jgi:16S rRNA (uracil1498-N3)-methyltransferase
MRRAEAFVFVEDLDLLVVPSEAAHHLIDVLRLRPGAAVIATDGRGSWRPCRYVLPASAAHRRAGNGRHALSAGAELLEVDGEISFEANAAPMLGVGFAMTKGDRPELTVQKLTELGINSIVPILTERTVVRLDANEAVRRGDRLRRIAREAAAQSRRVWLPEVVDPISLARVGEVWTECYAMAEPGGGPMTASTRYVLVGPEGGWAPGELLDAATTVGLGLGILRSETAAIVAGALLSSIRSGLVAAASGVDEEATGA